MEKKGSDKKRSVMLGVAYLQDELTSGTIEAWSRTWQNHPMFQKILLPDLEELCDYACLICGVEAIALYFFHEEICRVEY